MCLVRIWNNLDRLGKSDSFSEAVDHPATFTKINIPPEVFLCFVVREMVPNCKIYQIFAFLHFQETLSLDFVKMSFPKIVLAVYCMPGPLGTFIGDFFIDQ